MSSLHDLSDEERAAVYAAADERCAAEVRALTAEYKVRPLDPRSPLDYRGWNTANMVCVLVVKHRDKPQSIECSRDGSFYPPTYIPHRKMILQPESTLIFKLLIVPKWLAVRSELIGVTLPLSPTRIWSPLQEEQWERLRKFRMSINTKIYWAKRRPQILLSRAEVA